MNGVRPLLVLLVPGIGPADPPVGEAFLARLRAEVTRRLDGIGQPGLAARLIMDQAEWTPLFKHGQCAWLKTLFHDQARRWTRVRRVLVMLGMVLVVPAIIAFGTGEGMAHLGASWWSGVAGTLVGLIVAGVAAWYGILPLFPWGHLLAFGRPFEAFYISDIIVYGSKQPRQQIDDVVLTTLERHVPRKYDVIPGDSDRLPVIFIGHSLGAVVVYDLLLGTSARMNRAKTTAVQRELCAIKRQLRDSAGTAAEGAGSGPQEALHARQAFLERADRIENTLFPVGMVTMGSPIALFLFRKPSIVDRTDLWKEACPKPFGESGCVGGLRWRWQNFWHSSDLVAHRVEPLFNDGYPVHPSPDGGARFVEDVKTAAPTRDPLSAHQTYWTDPAVLARISQHLVDVLTALP